MTTTNNFGRKGTAMAAGPGGSDGFSPTAGSPLPPMLGHTVVGGPEHGVPVGLVTPLAPHPSRMGLRVSVGRYTAQLRRAYTGSSTGFATGALHAATDIDRTLDANPVLGGACLSQRLIRLCEEYFELYAPGPDGYSTGAVMVAGDLYIALNTWPNPDACGEVLQAPIDARTTVVLGGAA